MQRGEWRSRSQYISWVFDQFMEALSRGETVDMRADGRRRGKNAIERQAMWQAHDTVVCKRFKLLETSLKIQRRTLARAAIAWHLRRLQAVAS